MSSFPVLTPTTAPVASRPALERLTKAYGFVPNLAGVLAAAPAALEAYLTIAGIFEKTSLSPTERQVVLLAASVENTCQYCVAAHSTIAAAERVGETIIAALREQRPLGNQKLEALRQLTVAIVATRGRPSPAIVAAFLGAGYTPPQLLEVLVGVAQKTLSNYVNHIAETPIDPAFAPNTWRQAA